MELESNVRVIAGKYRSRRLQTLRGTALRPSSDRLRETLFNILGAAVEGSIFVDLFAGSGAVGIEALSRGARGAIFVENHPAGAALIASKSGIAWVFRRQRKLPAVRRSQEVRKSFAWMRWMPSNDWPKAARMLTSSSPIRLMRTWALTRTFSQFLGESELLARSGRMIAEHRRKSDLPTLVGHLERIARRGARRHVLELLQTNIGSLMCFLAAVGAQK